MTTCAADFRIEQVHRATVNGRAVKMFTAFAKHGDAFIHAGKFTAPPKTATRDLWKVAAAAA